MRTKFNLIKDHIKRKCSNFVTSGLADGLTDKSSGPNRILCIYGYRHTNSIYHRNNPLSPPKRITRTYSGFHHITQNH